MKTTTFQVKYLIDNYDHKPLIHITEAMTEMSAKRKTQKTIAKTLGISELEISAIQAIQFNK